MTLSIIVLMYSIILSCLNVYNRKIFSKASSRYFLLALGFALMQILRIECQKLFPDIPEYFDLFRAARPYYEIINTASIKDILFVQSSLEVEGGYNFFMSLFKCISNNYQLYLLFVSCVEYFTFAYFCRKNKINFVIALPVYLGLTFIAFQIGMLRQALAFCIYLFALLHIKSKWKYFGLVILGFLFHRSMVFCGLLFWANKYIAPKYMTFIFMCSLIIYLFKIELVNDIWSRIMVNESSRVNFYLNVDRENNFLGVGFWERTLIFIAITYSYRRIPIEYLRNNSIMVLFYNLGCSLIFLQMIFFSSPTITSRLRYYVIIFPILFLLEYIRTYVYKKNNRLILVIPIYLYLILYNVTQGGYLRGVIE